MSAFSWTLTLSLACAVVGFWVHMYDVLNDKISIRTKWKDLTIDQLVNVIMTISGSIIFIVCLIVAAIIK